MKAVNLVRVLLATNTLPARATWELSLPGVDKDILEKASIVSS
jgi:hypothetical protein